MPRSRTTASRPAWRVSCGGSFRLGNKVFKDLHVHGSIDMIESIQRSCNVYFYQLMLKIGLDAWSEMGARFGFGKLTGIDILEENPGLLPSTAYMNRRYGTNGWTRGFLPSLGIGQGELGVTPLQMAVYAMVLANRGEYHQPHTVRAVVDRQHNSIDTLLFQTRMLKISPRTWDIVREGMRRVVEEPGGTGGLARIAGHRGGREDRHGAEPPRPRPCVVCRIRAVRSPPHRDRGAVENAGFGGSMAAPIAGQCMERYLRRILPPAETPPGATPSPSGPPRPIAAAEEGR